MQLIFSAVTLPLACRYLERIWGPYELLRFSLVTIVGSNIIAFGFSWLVYIVTRSEASLWVLCHRWLDMADLCSYGLPYHGLTALQIGFLVAFTQLIPEHQLQMFGLIKMRVKVCLLSMGLRLRLISSEFARNLPSDFQRPRRSHGPVAIHSHSIRLLRRLGLSPFLQAFRGRHNPRRP